MRSASTASSPSASPPAAHTHWRWHADLALFADPTWLMAMMEGASAMFAFGVQGYTDDRIADGVGRGSFDVSTIRCPVEVLHGGADTIVPVAHAHAHHTASMVPGATLHIVNPSPTSASSANYRPPSAESRLSERGDATGHPRPGRRGRCRREVNAMDTPDPGNARRTHGYAAAWRDTYGPPPPNRTATQEQRWMGEEAGGFLLAHIGRRSGGRRRLTCRSPDRGGATVWWRHTSAVAAHE